MDMLQAITYTKMKQVTQSNNSDLFREMEFVGNMGENSCKEITVTEIAYFLYFTVMFGYRACGLYEGRLLYQVSLVVGMLLFIAKVALTDHTVLEYAFMGLLLFISGIVYYNTGEKGLLLYFTMMLGMKGVSVRRIFRLGTIILSISFSTLVLLSVTGIKSDITYLADRTFFKWIIRRSLGYPYPNTLFTTYIVLMVLIIYMLGEQSKKNLLLTSLFMFIGAVYIFIYSCSNTGIIVSVFYLLVNLYLQFRKSFSKIEKVGVQMVYPACLAFSIAAPLLIKGERFQMLDRILHNRMAYPLYYLTNEPITLLGVRFGKTPNINYTIDSSFLYSFLQLGIIPFVIVTMLFLCMIHDYVKREQKTEAAIIVSFCLLGLSDPFLFNLSYKNLMFLFVGEYVYRKLRELESRNLGILNKKYQCLSIGNKVLSYDTPIYNLCCERLRGIKEAISKNNMAVSLIYILSACVIMGVTYIATYTSHITGRVDEPVEWEYVRRVLSLGLWGAVVIAAVYLYAVGKRNKYGK